MSNVFRSHPFLLLGLVTYAIFLTVEALPREAHASSLAQALMPVARVIIIPMYLGWLVITIVAVQLSGTDPSGAGRWVIRVLQLVAGFAPYLLADALLRWRRSLRSTPAT